MCLCVCVCVCVCECEETQPNDKPSSTFLNIDVTVCTCGAERINTITTLIRRNRFQPNAKVCQCLKCFYKRLRVYLYFINIHRQMFVEFVQWDVNVSQVTNQGTLNPEPTPGSCVVLLVLQLRSLPIILAWGVQSQTNVTKGHRSVSWTGGGGGARQTQARPPTVRKAPVSLSITLWNVWHFHWE